MEGSKVCLEYHIFHYPSLTFILVLIALHALLKGTNNGESLKMAVGQQILSTSFAHAINLAAEEELEEDVLQHVMATTIEGTFIYMRMSFGLCNAPASFQRCMMAIFSDLIENVMEVFMDDFSVYGKTFEDCLANLDKVLR
jgi:hypothetical protein